MGKTIHLAVLKKRRQRLRIVVGTAKALAVWLPLLLLLAGCSFWKSWSTGDFTPPADTGVFSGANSDRLKLQIGVVPFSQASAFGDETIKQTFQNDLLQAAASACPDVIFIEPGAADYPEALLQLPRLPSGDVDNYRLALTGRQYGLNGILVGTVASVNVDEKEKGFWFLRETHYYVQVEVLLELYDPATAAKLFDRSLAHKVEVEEADVELIRTRNRIAPVFIEEPLKQIVADLKETLCDAVEALSWKSYIAGIGNGEVLVAAGRRSGVRPGDVFDVFDNRRTLEGFGQHRYFIPGEKVGEIEVVTVLEDHARSVAVLGGPFEEGQSVRLKK